MKQSEIVDIEAPEVIEQEPKVLAKQRRRPRKVKSKVENVFPFGDCLVPDVKSVDNINKKILQDEHDNIKPSQLLKSTNNSQVSNEKFEVSELVFKDKDLDITISNNLSAILRAKKLLDVYEGELVCSTLSQEIESKGVVKSSPNLAEQVDIPDEQVLGGSGIQFKRSHNPVSAQCPSGCNSDCTPENCDCDCHLFVHGEPKVPILTPEVPKKTFIKKIWGWLPFVRKKSKAPEQKPEVPVVEEKRDVNNEIILAICPLCKDELKKEWIKQEGENFKQKMICKKCKFEKEYIFSI